MKQQINEIKRMQQLAGLINENEMMDDEDEDFDLQAAFQASPMSHSYNEVLEIIESYEDESILNDFKAEFPEGEDISRKDYSNFAMNYVDDMSEVSNIQANWISISDPDIYDKAGLYEEIGGDIGDAEAEKEMDFLAEYEVIYQWEGSKCYRVDDEGNRDEVNPSYCQRFAEGKEEEVEEAIDIHKVESADEKAQNLMRNISTNSNIPTEEKAGLLDALQELMDFIEDVGYDAEREEEDGPVSDYSKRRAAMELNETPNPEGDKLVLRFLQGIAKKFDYPVAQAALFVKERIKSLGY
jgi:hypothetical protein